MLLSELGKQISDYIKVAGDKDIKKICFTKGIMNICFTSDEIDAYIHDPRRAGIVYVDGDVIITFQKEFPEEVRKFIDDFMKS